jgi:AcrR family transcriptional regulator
MDIAQENKIVKRKPGRPSTNDTRRKEILDKSTECFIKYGYNKTTLDEIGDSIGFNKAALYYYFKNKEELFIQVVNAQLLNGLTDLKNKIQKIENPEEQLLQYFWNRTKVFTKIIKLTNLTNENILNLYNTFQTIYAPYKKQEIEFLVAISSNIIHTKKKDSVLEFINLCFEIVNSMSFSSIMLHSITKDNVMLEEYNEKKNTVLKHLLFCYKNS